MMADEIDWVAAGITGAYETCPNCRGSGMQDAMDGPVTCRMCHGDCSVRMRDAKGRYTTTVPVRRDQP